ncbi:MAG: glycosyl transferase family 90 [Chlamydiales bacterium]
MKKIWISLLLLAITGGIFVQWKKTKIYLKEETMLRHLKREPFLNKPPAPWMLEQIEDDFQGIGEISMAAIDAAFAEVKHLTPWVVRYRIMDNELYRYFVEGEPITLKDNSTEKAIKTLMQKTCFPDMDFLISYLDPFPFLPYPLNAPILVSAKLKNVPNGILIPDWRSIGHWWMSDIKAVLKARIPWSMKKPFAIWRGSFTKAIREKLCQLSFEHPDQLDARLNQCPANKEQYRGERCSWDDFLACKYLPYVDGVMCAAPALQWRLLSGSLTFKPDSEEIQWFYRALEPYVHFVPLKSDLSDLIEQLKWAQSHDSLCQEMADKAALFAYDNLLYGDVLHYTSLVLKRYATSQQIDSVTLRREIDGDPHWVNIQYRSSIRDQAEKCKDQSVKFCAESTPPN